VIAKTANVIVHMVNVIVGKIVIAHARVAAAKMKQKLISKPH